jgi:hypothetical protein
MRYAIALLRVDELIGLTPWPGTLASALQRARSEFDSQRLNGATRVEIRDETGRVLYVPTLNREGLPAALALGEAHDGKAADGGHGHQPSETHATRVVRSPEARTEMRFTPR